MRANSIDKDCQCCAGWNFSTQDMEKLDFSEILTGQGQPILCSGGVDLR